jgi:hypothetical protein
MILKCIFTIGLLAAAQNAIAQYNYIGDAAAAKANVLGAINATISDTGSLPNTGGSLSAELANANVPGILDLHLLSASTTGQDNNTHSQASVTDVTIHVAGINITASVLASNANASCAGLATVNGGSTIAALKVNGVSVNVTGAPNQVIPLIVGSLIINEQLSSVTNNPGSNEADIVVNALHLKVNLLADVVISRSHAGCNSVTFICSECVGGVKIEPPVQ